MKQSDIIDITITAQIVRTILKGFKERYTGFNYKVNTVKGKRCYTLVVRIKDPKYDSAHFKLISSILHKFKDDVRFSVDEVQITRM